MAGSILGFKGVGDAYNIANTIPNIIYDLLLGGILSATLIPVFVDEWRRDDPRERDRAISAILTTAAAALLILTVGLYILAPVLIHVYLVLNHTRRKSDELAVGISLLRLFSPQVFFLGAIVISTALLNARRRFASAAFSPIINNAISIAALVATDVVAHHFSLAAFRQDHRGLLVLGIGTTLGYVVQFLVQIPAMIRTGVRLRPVWQPRHPAVRRVVGLSAWLIGVVITNQVSYNLIVVIASKRPGDYTVYQTAYQFFQLPYALFAVSVTSAIMPDLAERWAAQQRTAFLARVISGLRVTLALLVPAAIGFAFIASPVIELAFHFGHTTRGNAHLISSTLVMFSLGLPGFSAFLPLVRALQAMKDTRALFVIYALENALTVILAFLLYPGISDHGAARLLYPGLGDRGLAIAFAGPYTIAAIVAAVYLHRKVGPLGGVYTARAMGRILTAAGVMALALLALGRVLPHTDRVGLLVLRVVVEVIVATVVYVWGARWLGISDLDPVLRPVRAVLARVVPPGETPDRADGDNSPYPAGRHGSRP